MRAYHRRAGVRATGMDGEPSSWTVIRLDGPGTDGAVPGTAPGGRTLAWLRHREVAPFLSALLSGTGDAVVIEAGAAPDPCPLLARVNEAAPGLPVIVVGAGDVPGVRVAACLAAGADAVLPAGTGADELAAVLAARVERSRRALQDAATARETTARLRAEQARSRRFHLRLRELVHEVGTSATILEGYTANLLDGIDGPVTEAQRGSLQRMRVASEVLSGVLAKTREESDKDAPPPPGELADARVRHRVRLRPGELAAEAVGLVQRAFAGKDVALELEADPACPAVWGERLRLLQLLLALLDNALRHTPPRGRVRVKAAAAPADAFPEGRPGVRLVVRDTGPGIPRKDRQRVFLPGVSSPGDDGRAHSGLGLTVCREVAAEHGGALAVDEPPGGGASFRLDLPCDPRARRGALRITVVDEVLAGQVLEEAARGDTEVQVRRADRPGDLPDASSPGGAHWLVVAPPGSGLARTIEAMGKGPQR